VQNSTTQLGRKSWKLGVLVYSFRIMGTVLPGLTSRLALKMMLTPKRKLLAERDKPTIDRAQHIQIPFNGLQLAGYVWGEGQTIVLVHGWGGRGSSLSAFVTPLTQHGFRVVAFDAPAHGESEGKQTDPVSFGKAVESVIAQFGPVHAVIAHSFGAASTMVMLAAQSHAIVPNVVLLSSPSGFAYALDLFAKVSRLPKKVINQMREALIARFGAAVDEGSVLTAARSISARGVVVHDCQDSTIPYENAEAITRAWAGSALVTTKGLGHDGILRDYSVIEKVATFLTER